MNEYINDILDCKISKFTSTSPQSTNSQRKHLKQIFTLIFEENLRYKNKYGYSEISSLKFKKIDKRHYRDLLLFLEENSLIKIRRSLSGVESYSGKIEKDIERSFSFCKGYKVNPDLLENSGILLSDIDNSIIKYTDIIKYPIPNPSHSIKTGGYSSLGETVTTFPQNWIFEDSWKSLILQNDPDLSEEEYCDYTKSFRKPYRFKEGRFYGGFHFMKNDHIQYLRLFNEQIQEWGDGTAFFTKLIGKLIEDVEDIPYQEKYKFQQFAINDPYIHLMKKLNLNNREDAKKLLNIYVNSINQSATKMRNIDEYFQATFPHIRMWLRSIQTTRVKDKETGKMKTKKQLWKLNQNMEYQIMKKLCTRLNKEYGVFPLTKHDAIYLNTSDIEKLKQNNVSFQTEMKKTLNFQYYNDLLFDL